MSLADQYGQSQQTLARLWAMAAVCTCPHWGHCQSTATATVLSLCALARLFSPPGAPPGSTFHVQPRLHDTALMSLLPGSHPASLLELGSTAPLVLGTFWEAAIPTVGVTFVHVLLLPEDLQHLANRAYFTPYSHLPT